MIRLTDVHKFYPVRGGQVEVLKGINLTVERGDHVCIVGGNGAGKSTLIRLISGIEQPSSGKIERTMRISWPLAFTGAFQGALTGVDNIRFICRVYDVAFEDVIDFVEDFSQLGRYLREPVKVYSSGMRARLAFALSMMIDFDCYLIDEVVAVGDSRFQQRCQEELFVKRADRALIIVSHDSQYLRLHAQRACVLEKGVLHHFADIGSALEHHQQVMAA
ncbi:ABC transporter ATP-binding protein [Sandarakinorhabdus limnophila]|jgi:capsular polysaccharide transport system ATP-binding protein|uniref:ABC transporter ATP-binding protein n=1 Tax=Sandarakinorhabdus limnophila TaxID=210512 RepID=UPI0026EF436C|nr:ABC transporter ATP-binding protein [Sandarakinorhabdus limnophila]